MSAVNQGKFRWAIIGGVACGGGLLLLVLSLRGTDGHEGPPPGSAAQATAHRATPQQAGPESAADTNSPAAAGLSAADMESLAPDAQTLTEILEGLPLPGISTTTGNLTNLTPAEEARAIALWQSEKSNWSRLRGFSGNIDIDYVDAQGRSLGSLKATIRMRVHDVDPKSVDWMRNTYPASYEIVLTDPQGRWSYTGDGTREGSKFACQDESLAETIKPLMTAVPSIAAQIWEPGDHFLHPGGRENPGDSRTSDFWHHHQPMKNPDAPGRPDCYIFAPSIGSRARNIYFFEDGRLTRAIYGPPHERIRYQDSFEGYEQVDGFAFPTRMSRDNGRWKRVMTFSGVKVELAADG